jgi:lipid II:glycine glycyltransferase (peptidoglycan interpeptide bridge formation enzyme)
MTIRILNIKDKEKYNSLIKHPVQTWEWGDFKEGQGNKIYRLASFTKDKMLSAFTLSFHKIPKTDFSIGTILRGPKVNEQVAKVIKKIATKEKAIFVKFEPDISKLESNMHFASMKASPKVTFYPHTFLIDLKKSEQQILTSMHSKTRYNIKIANRHGVEVKERTNDKGFEIYLKLLFDTTKRQGFYLHSKKYHRDLWNTLKKTNVPHIVTASYQGEVLSAFMLFHLKDQVFYPFGASSNNNRQVMAPTLLMWEAIRLAKKMGAKHFDMWGCLGLEAKESDSGFGFHRFKQGFSGELFEYVGTYDLVINPIFYYFYNVIDKYRWRLLRLKANFLKR